MRIIRGARLRRLALVMSLGVVAALAIAGATSARVDYGSSGSAPVVWLEGQPDKVTICHAAGLEGSRRNHHVALPYNAVFGPGRTLRRERHPQSRTRAGLPGDRASRTPAHPTCVRTWMVTRQQSRGLPLGRGRERAPPASRTKAAVTFRLRLASRSRRRPAPHRRRSTRQDEPRPSVLQRGRPGLRRREAGSRRDIHVHRASGRGVRGGRPVGVRAYVRGSANRLWPASDGRVSEHRRQPGHGSGWDGEGRPGQLRHAACAHDADDASDGRVHGRAGGQGCDAAGAARQRAGGHRVHDPGAQQRPEPGTQRRRDGRGAGRCHVRRGDAGRRQLHRDRRAAELHARHDRPRGRTDDRTLGTGDPDRHVRQLGDRHG